MYSAFFNRQPDSGGFVNSLEFNILCDSYGISPGSLSSSGSSSFSAASNTLSPVSSLENSLLNAINSARSQYGIGQLSLNPSLTGIARTRCTDMINRDYFSHNAPDGKNIFIILNEKGYGWQIAGENIYQCEPAGIGSGSAILNTWMASPSHRENILNGAFSQAGIGIIDSQNTRTVSIVFSN